MGAKYGITRQRVGQIVREFPWVCQAVQDRLRSLDENNGREGGKCQSSLRGEGGSSGEFWPLERPERTRWRRWCWTHWLQPAVSPTRKGGGVPSLAAEISRRWRLRGGAVWQQRSFAFLRPIRPPKLEAPRQYQAQRGLF